MRNRKAAELFGRMAENVASLILIFQGYSILARRWRCNAGEIDIIARRHRRILFIEVKYRHKLNQWYGIPQRQQRRIMRAAETFAKQYRISQEFELRFDVILIQTDPAAWPYWWRHLKNVWPG